MAAVGVTFEWPYAFVGYRRSFSHTMIQKKYASFSPVRGFSPIDWSRTVRARLARTERAASGMASARPLSADDLRLDVRQRFSRQGTAQDLTSSYAQPSESLPSTSKPTDVPATALPGIAAIAAIATGKPRSPNNLGTALNSAAKSPRWSRVASAGRMQLAVEEAEKVADVAGAAAQLMRLSSAFAGEPSPRSKPGLKLAALRATSPKEPASTAKESLSEGGGTTLNPPKERRGSATPRWMVGVQAMLGVQLGGKSQEVIAEGPTPLGQVTTTSSDSAP